MSWALLRVVEPAAVVLGLVAGLVDEISSIVVEIGDGIERLESRVR